MKTSIAELPIRLAERVFDNHAFFPVPDCRGGQHGSRTSPSHKGSARVIVYYLFFRKQKMGCAND